jgi:hypothetical protein
MNKLQLLKDYRASGGKGSYVSLIKEVRKFEYGGGIEGKVDGVKYNTPEYNKAFKENRIASYDSNSDMYVAPMLPEVEVKATKIPKSAEVPIDVINPYKKSGYSSSVIPTTYLKNKLGIATENISKRDTTINLNENPMYFARMGEVTEGNTILGGDFVEDAPTALTAYEYRNRKKDFIFSLGESKPLNLNTLNFYGVINNKLKIGKISDFSDTDVVVPARFEGEYSNVVKKNSVDLPEDVINNARELLDKYEKEELSRQTLKSNSRTRGTRLSVLPKVAKELNIDEEVLKNVFFRKNNKEAPISLLDSKGGEIYNNFNMSDKNKIIVYSNTSGKQQYIYGDFDNIMTSMNKFKTENPDSRYLLLDNGRYGYYSNNNNGLTENDFKSYSRGDLKRENGIGYNLISGK